MQEEQSVLSLRKEEGIITTANLQSLIYVVRGIQVMIDSDLATLYQVETSALNRAVKRNLSRFPEDFCFQLTKEEYENLKCQNGISSLTGGYGGRRTLPYAFTEQGISMLSSVLRSDMAVATSIGIMRAFVEMRHFLASNTIIFDRISNVEVKQLAFEKTTNDKFEEILAHLSISGESSYRIFFDGQIYDAFSLLCSIVKEANQDIVLIDNYVDIDTLDILKNKHNGVNVLIYTLPNTKLSQSNINKFNSQYPSLKVEHLNSFHDRFMILDGIKTYHIGASLKDAGRKCFGISLLDDKDLTTEIINRLPNR